MLIGVDWGTTNLRAALVAHDGTVVASVEAAKGITKVEPGAFESVLEGVIAPFRDKAPDAPVVLSGMVGSRNGWVEAPYVPVPADVAGLAASAVRVEAPSIGEVLLVPGVAVGLDGAGPADVMRGEETEVLGLASTGDPDATHVLPGTHSKWVRVAGGAITAFKTYMTGDAYAALLGHTILAKTATDEFDRGAFDDGVERARTAAPGDLLSAAFAIRAEILLGRREASETASMLSGLLIGAELVSGLREAGDIVIVGAHAMARRYEDACNVLGADPRVARGAYAARGQALIANARAG